MNPWNARFAACLLVGACSTDNFVGSDGGIDVATSDAPTDARVDGQTLDGGPLDAAKPDSDGGITGTEFSCNPPIANTIFCDDFENDASVFSGWSSELVVGGGAYASDTTTSASPTHSVAFSTPVLDGGLAWSQFLSEDIAASYNTVSARTGIRIHKIDTSNLVPLLRVGYSGVKIEVGALGGALALVVAYPTSDGGYSVTPTAIPLSTYTIDTWFSVRLEVVTSPIVSVTVLVDDVQRLALGPVAPSTTALDKVRDVYIGILYETDSSVATVVNFDNFLFRGY